MRERLRKARVRDVGKARAQGLINDAEAAQLDELAKAIDAAIAVDDFAPEEISPQARQPAGRAVARASQPSAAE